MAKDLKISLLLDFYGNMLTEKQRDVLDLYYNEDLSLAEIGESEGITRQGVRDSIKRGEAVLLELEEKLGLCEKTVSLDNELKKIYELASKIESYNNKYFYSADISSLSLEIKNCAERSLKQD